jgi:hypothetical protein
MANKSEWQEANRLLMAEQQKNLGDPPTAEEMLAFHRGELSAEEEERIRELLVAYPEVARMHGAEFPQESESEVTDETIAAGLQDLQRRLSAPVVTQRPPARFYIPTTIAAALALLFFGLYVQAESRARDRNREPYVLGLPQELDSDATRGSASATILTKDGDAYWLRPRLLTQVHFASYSIELHDKKGPLWIGHNAEPDMDGYFQIVIPHGFLHAGRNYQVRIFGLDGNTRREVGSYDVRAPAE